jgi:hypothetical protein
MGLKVHQDGFKLVVSQEGHNVIASVYYRLLSTCSHWKKDLRLFNTTFLNIDGNLSLMGSCKGQSIIKCATIQFQLQVYGLRWDKQRQSCVVVVSMVALVVLRWR